MWKYMNQSESNDLSIFLSRIISIGLFSLALFLKSMSEMYLVIAALIFLGCYYLLLSFSSKKISILHNVLLTLFSLALLVSIRFSILLFITLVFVPSSFYLLHKKLFK